MAAFSLTQRVDAAVAQANVDAQPFVPSHAQVAERLRPVINDLLLLGREAAVEVFRAQLRYGTWDMHVLAECKSAWTFPEQP